MATIYFRVSRAFGAGFFLMLGLLTNPAAVIAFTADGNVISQTTFTLPTEQSFEYANFIVLKHDGSALLVGTSQAPGAGKIRIVPVGEQLNGFAQQPQCPIATHDCLVAPTYYGTSSKPMKSSVPVGAYLPFGDNGALVVPFDAVYPDGHHGIGLLTTTDPNSSYTYSLYDQVSFPDYGGTNYTPTASAMNADGKLFVGGYFTNTTGYKQFFVLGFKKVTGPNSGYVIDTDTLYGRPAVSNFTSATAPDFEVKGIAVQADGKVVAVGSAISADRTDIAVARFDIFGNPDSSFNNTFNGNEIVVWSPGDPVTSYATAVAVKDNGQIFVAGYEINAAGVRGGLDNTFPIILRLNSDGSYAPSDEVGYFFGTANDESSYFDSILVESDGRILAGGVRNSVRSPNKNFLAARIDPNTLRHDFSFGLDGGTTVAFDDSGANADIAFVITSNQDATYLAGRVDESSGPVFGVVALTNHDTIFANGFGLQP